MADSTVTPVTQDAVISPIICSRCKKSLHPFQAFPGPSDGTRISYLCDDCFTMIVHESNTGTSTPKKE